MATTPNLDERDGVHINIRVSNTTTDNTLVQRVWKRVRHFVQRLWKRIW